MQPSSDNHKLLQNKTKQNKTKQNKTKQNKTKQNKTNMAAALHKVNVADVALCNV
jgi:predicted tellurium resistance membrane protein TerC